MSSETGQTETSLPGQIVAIGGTGRRQEGPLVGIRSHTDRAL